MGPAPFDKPQTVSHTISTVDLAPTMMDLAGLEYPYLTDGQSFLPLVRGDEVSQNETHLSRVLRLVLFRQFLLVKQIHGQMLLFLLVLGTWFWRGPKHVIVLYCEGQSGLGFFGIKQLPPSYDAVCRTTDFKDMCCTLPHCPLLIAFEQAFRNVVFSEDIVNRAVWGPNSMKLIHLNNVSIGLTLPDSGIPTTPILQLHPGAAAIYQLYNLTADPEEQVNLFYHSEYSLEAAKLLRG